MRGSSSTTRTRRGSIASLRPRLTVWSHLIPQVRSPPEFSAALHQGLRRTRKGALPTRCVARRATACYMDGVPVEDAISPSESQPIIRSASELRPGDRVVYPNQGVCRVKGTEEKEIAGSRLVFLAMTREEDSATILVPLAKVPTIGLRKVAGTVEIEDVFDLLASSFEDPELDWKVRHRHHVDLLAAGDILGVAEVVKALQGIANMRSLPQRERERYDTARRLLEDEISVALGVPLATAEDLIDFALIPPPGTVRAPRKPRRLAEIPVRPKAARPLRRPAAEDELEEFGEGLEEDLDLEAPLDEELAPEEPLEAEAEEGVEAVEPEPETAEPERKKARSRKKAEGAEGFGSTRKKSETAAAKPKKTGTRAKTEGDKPKSARSSRSKKKSEDAKEAEES
nr:MAG: CarD family transcriptional regulator [Pseudomonadota bacterium]